jgi:glucose dehydrogenase
MKSGLALIAASACLSLFNHFASAADLAERFRQATGAVTDARLRAAGANSDDWPAHGLDYAETRFSRLDPINTGNGAPWNRLHRSPGGGDNLYLSSILALRIKDGTYVWHYQTTPGDTLDFTATEHMILADLEIAGRPRKVIMQAPKNGFFYVID